MLELKTQHGKLVEQMRLYNSTVEIQIKEKRAELDKLRAECEEKEEALQVHQQKFANSNNEMKTLKSNIISLENKQNDLIKSFESTFESEIAESQNQLTSLSTKVEELQRKLDSSMSENSSLQRQLASSQQQLEQLTST